jgi:phage-Barnase-EndoU-ColicinE5/D-RelE like nuclease3
MDELKRKIEELYEFALNNPKNDMKMVEITRIEKELAETIHLKTGVDLLDFVIAIDNYGIKHTIERHGDAKKEAQLGQVAIQKSDFNLIEKIVREADSIRYDPRQKTPKSVVIETFIFEKKIDDVYYVVKDVRRVKKRGKQNTLVFQTMYIKKRRTL